MKPALSARLRALLREPACFFVLSLLFWECAFRALEGGPFRDCLPSLLWAVPQGLVFGLLCGLFKRPRPGRACAFALTLLCWVFYGSQMIYHRIFGTYYTWFSVTNGAAAATDFYREALAAIWANLHWILLLGLPFFFLLLWGRKALRFGAPRRLRGLGLGALMAYGLFLLSLPLQGMDQFTPYDLYFKSQSMDYSMERLGLSSTMRIDLQRLLTDWEPSGAGASLELEPPTVVVVPEPEPPTPPAEAPAEPVPEPEPEPEQEPIVYGDNVLDVDFAALAAAETDEELRNMHEYFAAQTPAKQNEMTGLFKGCNLIMLTCEGFSQYVVDETRTPTLYKMMTEGIHFTDFYTPIWSVSTSDGEYVACQGLVPKSGVWSFKTSGQNYLPFALGNQFSALGYGTRAYHNHTYTYYGRDISHPNLGYIYKGVGSGLALEHKSWPNSDVEMVRASAMDYVFNPPFHTYYMTVSGHLNYTFMGNQQAYNHRDEVADLPYSDNIRAYFACQQELEDAVTLLCQYLEQAGQLENTVFVLSADHYPYGLTDEELSELAGHPIDTEYEKYRNACIIYKPGMEPITVDEPCCSMDILPTVSNLFGLPYDSRLMMGRDVFSDAEPLVIFSNRSFITGDARYSTATRELTANEGVVLPEGYRRYWSAVVDDKFAYSAKILENDYYNVVLGGE